MRPFGLPIDQSPGLRLARADARADLAAGRDPADRSALDFERLGGFAVPKNPCGECAHFRFTAGQEMVASTSVKLDLTDMGWGKFLMFKEMGRCGLRDDLLTHRAATCDRWQQDARHRGRPR